MRELGEAQAADFRLSPCLCPWGNHEKASSVPHFLNHAVARTLHDAARAAGAAVRPPLCSQAGGADSGGPGPLSALRVRECCRCAAA